MSARSSLCLNMIVRDEAHVLPRCLASVRPHIDSWVIVDTGSTDDTAQVIARELGGIPGQLHQRPWRDFGANRTEALQLTAGQADYLFVVDADDVLANGAGLVDRTLTADSYELQIVRPATGLSWWRAQIMRSDREWFYRGRYHEYLVGRPGYRLERLTDVVVHTMDDGNRSRRPDGIMRDLLTMEEMVREDPDNPRDVFLLALAYQSAGRPRKALELLRRRQRMTGVDEEAWYCRFQEARILLALKEEWETVRAAFLAAYEARPGRAEPLILLARECRLRGEHAQAWVFATAAARVPVPPDRLFMELPLYQWVLWDELALASHFTRRFGDALECNNRLLQEGYLPPRERPRVLRNRRYTLEALGHRPGPHLEEDVEQPGDAPISSVVPPS